MTLIVPSGLSSLALARVRLMVGPRGDLGAAYSITIVVLGSNCSDREQHDQRTVRGKHELFTKKKGVAH